MRIAFLTALVAVALSIAGAALAQQAEPIVVASKIVARVRDAGDFTNVFQRTAKVQQRITECISKKEAGTPKMWLKKENERWSIYCHTTMLMQVWPGDAAPQNIDELSLAKMWLTNFERELPNAEPFRFKLAREGNAAYERPIKPATAENPGDEGTETGNPRVLTQAPPRSTALLVVLDCFDIMRTYSEEEYEAKKDVLGQRLIDRLRPFVLGTVEIEEPKTTSGAPLTTPAPGGVAPKLAPGAPAGPPPVPEAPTAPTPTTPTKTAAGTPPAVVPPEQVAEPAPPPPSGSGDWYAKVPQKQRIGRKMNAIRQPLADMRDRGDPQADRVEKLLAAARSKFYSGQFDQSEEAVDAALKILELEVK
ncbi:MAG: hypothetical protein PVH68_16905 [Armatimonadota bacterium]